MVTLEKDGYFGQHGVRQPRLLPCSLVRRLEAVLQEPPVSEPDPDRPDAPQRIHWIPLLLVRVRGGAGEMRQFRTESLEYLMLPWDEGEVPHYNPEFSLAVAALMPDSFLNRDCLLAGHPSSRVESLTDREEIARALQPRKAIAPTPQGPFANAIGRGDLERVIKLLALGQRPTLELLAYARLRMREQQIEGEAWREIQSARTRAQLEEARLILREFDRFFRDMSPLPSLAERAIKIVELLEKELLRAT